MWDPHQYEKFKRERARPFLDLFARLDDLDPATIVDLGCGTGELTVELSSRWPHADVLGLDSSSQMMAKAEQHKHAQAPGRLRFEQADIGHWSPSSSIDLVFSNAAFHWLDDHERQIERIAGFVGANGTMAFQMPNQGAQPSHQIVKQLCNAPRWNEKLGAHSTDWSIAAPAWYVRAFAAWGFTSSVWETVYYQVLEGENAVLEWLKGTTLRGILAQLGSSEQAEFLSECGLKLREAYPKTEFGTLLPYRRLFVVAKRN